MRQKLMFEKKFCCAREQVSVANGVNLTRIFFFINGKDQLQGKVQPSIGVFNETGLQRFDLILQMCNRYGIRAILAMVNFEDWMGK
jgi:endo-1,4-beta-mannosidase